jgi:hypothetical protein
VVSLAGRPRRSMSQGPHANVLANRRGHTQLADGRRLSTNDEVIWQDRERALTRRQRGSGAFWPEPVW